MIFVVTGSRHPSNTLVQKLVDLISNQKHEKYRFSIDDVLVQGNAPGIDRTAQNVWWGNFISVPARWSIFANSAGPKRNIVMIDSIKVDVVFAFPMPDSVGTFHCMDYAKMRGIPVEEFRDDLLVYPGR